MKVWSFGLVVFLVLFTPCFFNAETFIYGPYKVDIPDDWQKADFGTGSPFDVYYIADGTFFLPVMFNNGPVMVRAWIMCAEGKNLDEAVELIIQGYTQNPERIFQNGFSHEKEKLKLKSAKEAYIVSTRFFRKVKGLNQSRFDLVAFPKSGQKGVVYTISISYLDSTYEFEKKFDLKNHVRKLFSTFEFR